MASNVVTSHVIEPHMPAGAGGLLATSAH